ncbi:hypothetical protein RhiJN_07020 [Ceratobasidium sp. AG-Ba]|nr:hypothetical protein RhiJN_07020 [Ceratobasidium sp. AG-Ba]
MIVLPVFIAAFVALMNAVYLASHPDSFVSEMAAYTVLGASSSSVVKPATRMAIGYISLFVSNHPTSFSLPSFVADNLSLRVIHTTPTVSPPIGWRSAAPVFFGRDARIPAGWESNDIPQNDACLDRKGFSQARSTTDIIPKFTPAELGTFGVETDFNLALPDPLPSQNVTDCSNMNWPRGGCIPARPGSQCGVRFGWIMEVRTTVVALICALLICQLCIKSRPEDTRPSRYISPVSPASIPVTDDVDDLPQLEVPSIVSSLASGHAEALCYDNLPGRAINNTIYKSRSGSFASLDSDMSLASLCGGLSFADGRSTAGGNVLHLPDIAHYRFTFTFFNAQISPLQLNKKLGKVIGQPVEGSDNVELRPAKRFRLENTFTMSNEDTPAHEPTNEKSALGVPPLDIHKTTLSTVDACSSDLLPGHTQAVSVAHEESAALVPLDIKSDTSRISGPRDTLPAILPGPDTSASALVLSQARGQLLLLMCEEQCDPDRIRARILEAKRASAPSRSGSASQVLRLVIRRQKSGTMKAYQRHLVISGQVLNLAIADSLSSRQTPGHHSSVAFFLAMSRRDGAEWGRTGYDGVGQRADRSGMIAAGQTRDEPASRAVPLCPLISSTRLGSVSRGQSSFGCIM